MTDALDGNAAAGALAELFVTEMTVAVTACATCGDTRPLGELRAYLRAPGVVLRCASCDAVQVRLVRGPDRAWLDLRGVQAVQVELPSLPAGTG
ncbi:MAG TPA: DUF6510 family protein [Acidimicrobiales bacterium]